MAPVFRNCVVQLASSDGVKIHNLGGYFSYHCANLLLLSRLKGDEQYVVFVGHIKYNPEDSGQVEKKIGASKLAD